MAHPVKKDMFPNTSFTAEVPVDTEPLFTYNSSEMILKYKKFFPFIGAYLAYKILWRI